MGEASHKVPHGGVAGDLSAGVPGRQGPRLGTMGEPEQQGRDGEGGGWRVEECGGGGVPGRWHSLNDERQCARSLVQCEEVLRAGGV